MQPPVEPARFVFSANKAVSKIFQVDWEKKKILLASCMVWFWSSFILCNESWGHLNWPRVVYQTSKVCFPNTQMVKKAQNASSERRASENSTEGLY